MFNPLIRRIFTIAALSLLVILACNTVQISVLVNIGLTSTAITSTVDQTPTPAAISETPAFAFVRSTTGGLSEIQQTLGRGHTWNTIKKVAWDSASFDFVDEQNGWAIVSLGANTLFLNTRDGGRNWEMLAPWVAS